MSDLDQNSVTVSFSASDDATETKPGAPANTPPTASGAKRRPVSTGLNGNNGPATNGSGNSGSGNNGVGNNGVGNSGGGMNPQRKPQGARKPSGPQNKDEMDLGRIMRTVLLWAALFLGVVLIVVVFSRNNNPAEVEVSTSEYQRLLDSSLIQSGKVEQYGLNQT